MAAVAPTSAVSISPRRLAHANLFVGELERSNRFFNQVCGLELVRFEPAISAAFLSNGNTHHDIGSVQAGGEARVGLSGHVQVPAGRGKLPGLNHIGWEMDSEAALVAAWRRAVAAGVKIHRTADHQLAHSMYLFDPDGNLHEFYADVVDDWRTVFNHDREDLITSHWDPESAPASEKPRWPHEPRIRVVPDAVFKPRRMAGAALVARNFGRLRAFFTEIAGLKEIYASPSNDMALMRGSATREGWDLALFASREGLAPGLHHMVLEMTDEAELMAAERRARATGVCVDFILDQPDKRSIFIRNPDGLRFEFRCARKGPPRHEAGAAAALQPFYV